MAALASGRGFSGWVALLAFAYGTIGLSCPPPKFTAAKDVKLTKRQFLLATHVSTQWDARFASKPGVDRTIAFAKRFKVPVVYLLDSSAYRNYFYDDCEPDYYVKSELGEFAFDFDAKEVTTIGGYFEHCHNSSVGQILKVWEKYPKEPLRLTLVMDAVYIYGSAVQSTDAYASKYEDFARVFGNRSITLLDLMRIINSKDGQNEFFKRYLGQLKLPIDHRILVEMDGKRLFTYREKDSADPAFTIDFTSYPHSPFGTE